MTHTEALHKFWGRVSQPGVSRLEWLRNAAEWKVDTVHRYLDVRRGSKRFARPAADCFCCQKKPASMWHHIIQIQYGGRNVEKNRAPICRECHRKIHPWLVKKRPEPRPVIDTRPRLVKRPGSVCPRGPGRPENKYSIALDILHSVTYIVFRRSGT